MKKPAKWLQTISSHFQYGHRSRAHTPSNPSWLKGAAKLLESGTYGDDWRAVGKSLGYKDPKWVEILATFPIDFFHGVPASHSPNGTSPSKLKFLTAEAVHVPCLIPTPLNFGNGIFFFLNFFKPFQYAACWHSVLIITENDNTSLKDTASPSIEISSRSCFFFVRQITSSHFILSHRAQFYKPTILQYTPSHLLNYCAGNSTRYECPTYFYSGFDSNEWKIVSSVWIRTHDLFFCFNY